jgi:hypothetical protein
MHPVLDKNKISMIIAKRTSGADGNPQQPEGEDDGPMLNPEEELMSAFMKAFKAGDAKRAVINFKRLMDVCSMAGDEDEDMEY